MEAVFELVEASGDAVAMTGFASETVAVLVETLMQLVPEMTPEERGDLLAELIPHGILDDHAVGELLSLMWSLGVSISDAAVAAIEACLPPLDVPPQIRLALWAKGKGWRQIIRDIIRRGGLRRDLVPNGLTVFDGWAYAAFKTIVSPVREATTAISLFGNPEEEAPDSAANGGSDPWRGVIMDDLLSARSEAHGLGKLLALLDEACDVCVDPAGPDDLRNDAVDAMIDELQDSVEKGRTAGDRDGVAAAQTALCLVLYRETELYEGKCVKRALEATGASEEATMASVRNPKAVVYALQCPLAQTHLAFNAVDAASTNNAVRCELLLYWLGVSRPPVQTEKPTGSEQGAERPATPAMRPDTPTSNAGRGFKLTLFRPSQALGGASKPNPPAAPRRWSTNPEFASRLITLIARDEQFSAPKREGKLTLRTSAHYECLKELCPPMEAPESGGGMAPPAPTPSSSAPPPVGLRSLVWAYRVWFSARHDGKSPNYLVSLPQMLWLLGESTSRVQVDEELALFRTMVQFAASQP